MGNKMFVIGGINTSSSEVFDSHSRKVTLIKSLIKLDHDLFYTVSLGLTIVFFSIPTFFSSRYPKMYVYDTEVDEYSAVDSQICEKLAGVSCGKYFSQD